MANRGKVEAYAQAMLEVARAEGHLAGVEDDLPALEKTYRALLDGPTTPEELAEALGIAVKTVRNHLTVLSEQGRAERLGPGRWQGISSQPNFPDSRLYKGPGIGKVSSPASEDEDEPPRCCLCGAPAWAMVEGQPYCKEHVPDDAEWQPIGGADE